MKIKFFPLIMCLVFSQLSTAQFVKERSIDIAIGYGLSAPYDNIDVVGTGFYLQGEYVLKLASWVELRPYAGLILARTNNRDNLPGEPDYRSDSNGALLGGKVRLTAPIPWIAPFAEIGMGTSIGSFETLTPFTNEQASGLIYHIPFSVGLALGPQNNVDLAFVYYFHPSVRQFAGAAAFGLSIPLD
jgi:hypothetical protein